MTTYKLIYDFVTPYDIFGIQGALVLSTSIKESYLYPLKRQNMLCTYELYHKRCIHFYLSFAKDILGNLNIFSCMKCQIENTFHDYYLCYNYSSCISYNAHKI